MSVAADTLVAAGRAASAGALATLAAWPLRHAFVAAALPPALLAAGVLVVAALPPLATSYAWTELAPRVMMSGSAAPWCLLLLLAARAVVPVALVLALLPPPAYAGAAAHVAGLAPATSGLGSRARRWVWQLAHGVGPVAAVGAAVGFLIAFADFELTARLAQRSWTVAVFDAQAGGVSVGLALEGCLLPVALAAVVLTAGWRLARRAVAARARAAPRVPPARRFVGVALACLLVALLPAGYLVADGAAHVADALRPRAARFELLWSAVYAGAASLGAGALSGALRGRVLLLLCLPGLGGALALALGVRSLCPSAVLDTPLPAAVALTLWLLPWAVFLRVALRVDTVEPSAHVARLLLPLDAERARTGARLLAALRGQPRLWSVALLFPLALQDIVIASVLAPPQATPLGVRLHNFAHYGHSHTLSALLLVGAGLGWLAIGCVAVVGAGTGRGWRHRSATTGHSH